MSIGSIIDLDEREGWCRIRYNVGIRNHFDTRWQPFCEETVGKVLKPIVVPRMKEVTFIPEIGYYNFTKTFWIRREIPSTRVVWLK